MLGCIGYPTIGDRLNLQSGAHTQKVPGESPIRNGPSSLGVGRSEQAPNIIGRGKHMQQKIRWAVVGTSDFALDWIARGIRMGGNSVLAAVVSRDAERAAAAAQRVGAPHSYPSIEAI